MAGEPEYEISFRECVFRRLVSREEVHRAVTHVSGAGHKLVVSTADD
jgi:hypothetical protein